MKLLPVWTCMSACTGPWIMISYMMSSSFLIKYTVEHILKNFQKVSPQVTTTLGFLQIKDFLDGKISEETCIQNWIAADLAYSKRQITWWKNEPQVTWIDKSESLWEEKFLQLVGSHF